jgi:hypothetical protein|tara:strand:+ start:4736 stop:5653 length:918 start_codon:yes stop_codon:yes gene_type:complete
MTIAEMHIAINLGVQKIASFQVDLFLQTEIDIEINKNIDRFVKQRYNALGNKYQTGFEESQKRIDDLRTLITESSIGTTFKGQIDNNVYIDTAVLPVGTNDAPDYMFLLNVRALVSYNNCAPIKTTNEFEVYSCDCSVSPLTNVNPTLCDTAGGTWVCTYTDLGNRVVGNYAVDGNGSFSLDPQTGGLILLPSVHQNTSAVCKFSQLDDVYKLLEDPFNKTKHTQPLYTVVDNNLDFYTDDTFIISKVKYTYISHPAEVSFTGSTDCDLPFHTHQEIVSMTVSSILEGISDPRYQTSQIEVHKSE